MIVIDASVAVKWYQYEAGQDAAASILLEHAAQMRAPDLFVIEVTAALVRHANMHKPAKPVMQAAIQRFRGQIASGDVVSIRTTDKILMHASDLALMLGHPLKDCIYLALAMELACPLVTADTRFAAKAQGVYGDVQVLGGG